jgi:hypothetical protein
LESFLGGHGDGKFINVHQAKSPMNLFHNVECLL